MKKRQIFTVKESVYDKYALRFVFVLIVATVAFLIAAMATDILKSMGYLT